MGPVHGRPADPRERGGHRGSRRREGRLDDAALAEINAWYRGAVAKGIADNQHKRSRAGKDGLRLARRFRDHQDMILRFATDLAVGFTSNQADYAEFGVMPAWR